MLHKFIILAVLFVSLATVSVAQNPDSQNEKLALLAKPAVVRIYDGYLASAVYGSKTYQLSAVGAGSGAFIDSNGYIITNAHVVNFTRDKDNAIKLLYRDFAAQVARTYQTTTDKFSDNGWRQVSEAFKASFKSREIQTVVLPSGDKYNFNFTNAFGAPVGYGKDVAVIKIEIKNAPILKLADSDKVKIQDHITVVGYPAAAESQILDDKSLLQSSITDGKVSALKNMTDGSPVLEVSAPATHGNSGGPVINDNGEIVGLLTFGGNNVGGQEIQGFNFVITSNTVKEFVKQVGASNEASVADQTYREGLDLYFKGRYRSALEKFQQVNNLFPQHSEIKTLIQVCETKKHEETNYTMIGLIIFGIIVVLIGGAIVLTFIGVLTYRLMFKKPDDSKSAPLYQSNPINSEQLRYPRAV